MPFYIFILSGLGMIGGMIGLGIGWWAKPRRAFFKGAVAVALPLLTIGIYVLANPPGGAAYGERPAGVLFWFLVCLLFALPAGVGAQLLACEKKTDSRT